MADTTNQAPRNKIHVALQNDVSTKFSMNVMPANLAVPPWGGVFGIPLGGQISLVNTCPIDNSHYFLCFDKTTHEVRSASVNVN